MSKPTIADRIGIALHNAGARSGFLGEKAARVLSDVLIGRHLEDCGDHCGHCAEVEYLRRR